MPRPRPLTPIEVDILEATIESARAGEGWIHGYAIAKRIRDGRQARRLTAQGTLYKALARLDESGLLERRWEDPDAALAEGRPRRRLYRVTGPGRDAVAARRRADAPAGARPRVVPA